MKRLLLGLTAAAGLFALPAVANAYTAYVVADLNLRACASTQCAAVTVIPGGTAVNVLGSSGGWNYVAYAGVTGYASANYITVAYATPRPPVVVRPPIVVAAPYGAYPVYPYYPYQRRAYLRPGFSFSFRISG